MKTKHLLITGCMLSVLCGSLSAQNTEKIEKTVHGKTFTVERTEKTVHGETYIIETPPFMVKNKKNKLPIVTDCKYVTVKDVSQMDSVIKKVFPKARMSELIRREAKLSITFSCDTSGKIEEVTFFLREESPITLEELYLLEKNLKGVKVNISSYCPDTKFFSLRRLFKFKELIQE